MAKDFYAIVYSLNEVKVQRKKEWREIPRLFLEEKKVVSNVPLLGSEQINGIVNVTTAMRIAI